MKRETVSRIRKGLLILILIVVFVMLGTYLLGLLSGNQQADNTAAVRYEETSDSGAGCSWLSIIWKN